MGQRLNAGQTPTTMVLMLETLWVLSTAFQQKTFKSIVSSCVNQSDTQSNLGHSILLTNWECELLDHMTRVYGYNRIINKIIISIHKVHGICYNNCSSKYESEQWQVESDWR